MNPNFIRINAVPVGARTCWQQKKNGGRGWANANVCWRSPRFSIPPAFWVRLKPKRFYQCARFSIDAFER